MIRGGGAKLSRHIYLQMREKEEEKRRGKEIARMPASQNPEFPPPPKLTSEQAPGCMTKKLFFTMLTMDPAAVHNIYSLIFYCHV